MANAELNKFLISFNLYHVFFPHVALSELVAIKIIGLLK